jgi:hypothetical protein
MTIGSDRPIKRRGYWEYRDAVRSCDRKGPNRFKNAMKCRERIHLVGFAGQIEKAPPRNGLPWIL